MSDDCAVASAAAETVIQTEIKAFVPSMFQNRIPAGAIHKMADEIAKVVVDALAKAHAAPNT
jgi:hypothetical protein